MKLKNKKTGEVIEVNNICSFAEGKQEKYSSLKEFNEVWEDYKELVSDYWYIATEVECGLDIISSCDCPVCKKCRDFNDSIGNLFKTKEEAEKAVEKLKAVKRLKEANIDYKLSREYDDFTETMHANVSFSFNSYPLVGKDLDLLFGGKE